MSEFPVLDIATIAYDVPWAIAAQIRLLRANLTDAHLLTVFDNSGDPDLAREIEQLALESCTRYVRVGPPGSRHEHALNVAARDLTARGLPYCAFLDHDVFPRRQTHLTGLIEVAGFYGLPQRHGPTDTTYLWPGLACFSRSWLGDRPLDFKGIRGEIQELDGDTGSMLGALFEPSEWSRMPRPEHAYQPIRDVDDDGVQSWGVELIGDWLHVMNASRWKSVRDPEGRARLVRDLIEAL
jgi:hypothetical protein